MGKHERLARELFQIRVDKFFRGERDGGRIRDEVLTVKFFVQVAARRHRERSYELLELYRAVLKQQADVSLFIAGASRRGDTVSIADRFAIAFPVVG